MVTYNGVPAPWLNYFTNHGGGDFLAYTANGLVPTIYSVNNVANASLTFGAGSQLVNTIPSDIVNIQNSAANTDNSIGGNRTIYAIHTGQGFRNRKYRCREHDSNTLTVTSGGIAADQQNGTMTFGVAAANATATNQQVNVQFGDGSTTEAVIWASEYNGATSIVLNNTVSSGPLTKTGPGNLYLSHGHEFD